MFSKQCFELFFRSINYLHFIRAFFLGFYLGQGLFQDVLGLSLWWRWVGVGCGGHSQYQVWAMASSGGARGQLWRWEAGLKLELGPQSSVSCIFSPGVRWQLEPHVGWGVCYGGLSTLVQSTSHFSDWCLCAGTSSKQIWVHIVRVESCFLTALW